MNPKQLNGIPARLPLKPGLGGRAVDALGAPVFDNGRVSAPIDWEDVMNDPAWGPKGYPSGFGSAAQATILTGGGGGGTRAAAKCECGADATYGASATHSSWCAKAGAV